MLAPVQYRCRWVSVTHLNTGSGVTDDMCAGCAWWYRRQQLASEASRTEAAAAAAAEADAVWQEVLMQTEEDLEKRAETDSERLATLQRTAEEVGRPCMSPHQENKVAHATAAESASDRCDVQHPRCLVSSLADDLVTHRVS